jgi:hypothetical protein
MLLFGDKNNEVNRVNWMAMPFSLSFSGDTTPFSQDYGVVVSHLRDVEQGKETYISSGIFVNSNSTIPIDHTSSIPAILRNLVLSHNLLVNPAFNLYLSYSGSSQFNNTIPFSFLLNLNFDKSLVLEHLEGNEAILESAVLEYLSDVLTSEEVSLEHILSAGFLQDIVIDWSSLSSIDKTAVISHILELQQDVDIPVEHNLNSGISRTLILEHLLSLITNKDIVLEHEGPAVLTFPASIMIESSLLLNTSATANLSYSLSFADEKDIPLEYGIGQSVLKSAVLSYLIGIENNYSLILSSLVDLTINKDIYIDYSGNLLINKNIVLEYNRAFEDVDIPISIPVEHLIGIDGEYYIRIEWFGDVISPKILKWILKHRNTNWNTNARNTSWNLKPSKSGWNM